MSRQAVRLGALRRRLAWDIEAAEQALRQCREQRDTLHGHHEACAARLAQWQWRRRRQADSALSAQAGDWRQLLEAEAQALAQSAAAGQELDAAESRLAEALATWQALRRQQDVIDRRQTELQADLATAEARRQAHHVDAAWSARGWNG